MRDGTRLYADVFRPANASEPVPALVNWAPYGKGGTGEYFIEDSKTYPNRLGIPRSATSGLQSWEANDPSLWCDNGYAIVQVDARGAFNSEGIIMFNGSQEGRDGHDAIEAIAALPWCTGKVGLAGNSWLAFAQWQIAAQKPAHLAAIAPWEGLSDIYRDFLVRGGIPEGVPFAELLMANNFGKGEAEDVVAMLDRHPLFDEYWQDKAPPIEEIECPAYVVAAYANLLHTNGTFRAWSRLRCPRWLRIHNTLEWIDFYNEKYGADLMRFFDRYLKGIDNGWEETSPVRMVVFDPGHRDIVDRPEAEFPPARAVERALHLNLADGKLTESPSPAETRAAYRLSAAEPQIDLLHRFDRNTEIVGYPMLRLWVSVEGHDDADVYVQMQKLSAKGKMLRHQMIDLGLPGARTWMPWLLDHGVSKLRQLFYNGPEGKIRASRRGLLSDHPLHHDLNFERKIVPGKPVALDIPLGPVAMRWHAGEQLRLRISGIPLVPMRTPEMLHYPPDPLQRGDRHTFISGGRYPAALSFRSIEF
ncbi:CocE/NonD family hydrolase [Sphingobium sp. MK2]|uniref:CocE/NonD family hydrolase n=1 Tax=Sphingobium sp. MK2 TaxID=3116540 RepID=UPI0032E358C7